MSEKFDYAKYHSYINHIVLKLDDVGNPNLFKILIQEIRPIMDLFGMAILSYDYTELPGTRGVSIKEFGLPDVYLGGEPNRDCEVSVFKKIADNVSVRLFACPYKDTEPWDEEMRGHVAGFLNLFFNLVARVRMFQMFEARVFCDMDMPFVGNIRSLMRDMGRLQKQEMLVNYTAYRINICKFARFNRTYGRHRADQILNRYITTLKGYCDENTNVYRLGGDNFIGLIPNSKTEELTQFFKGYSFILDDGVSEVFIQARVGFYKIDNNYLLLDSVLKRTNGTFAKTDNKNKICFFDHGRELLEEEEDQIEHEFVEAMKKGDILPYYQPKVDLENNQIVSVEALCRWEKEGIVIGPYRFIPIIERTNQICQLDFYMLRKVCEDVKRWSDQGRKTVPVSVNFSRNNLADKKFVEKIINIIDEYSIPRDIIVVELTETSMEEDFEEIANVVYELKQNNVRTAVDDFGMGYSSLNLIKDIKWDILKIDKNFVPDKANENYDRYFAMLKNVVSMANDIGMMPIVEGVETEEQLAIVKECGCKIIQGYYYDRPLRKSDLEAKLLGLYPGECKWRV